MIDVVDS